MSLFITGYKMVMARLVAIMCGYTLLALAD